MPRIGLNPVFTNPARTPAEQVPRIFPAQFERAVSQGRVVVEFFNFGCPYCNAARPHLDAVAKELEGNTKVLKMSLGNDQDAHRIVSRYIGNGRGALPIFAVFENGQHVGTFERQGRDHVSKDFIKNNIRRLLG